MKDKIHTLLLAGIIGTSACSGSWREKEIPEAVEARIAQLYPTAKQVNWESGQENYEARFQVRGRERSVLFAAEGRLLQYSEEIQEQYLPRLALENLRDQYGNFEIEEAHRVQHQNSTYYKVELEQGKQELLLLVGSHGKILSQQPAVPAQSTRGGDYFIDATGQREENERPAGLAKSSWELPSELREVSGISFVRENLLACVQDEKGIIFLYDLAKETVTRRISFAGPGDYEGIAVVGHTAYLLRSDGAIYEVTDFMGSKSQTTMHPSVLVSTQNTEGLAYDRKQNRLLVAAKGYDESLGNYKGIYAIPLNTKKMQAEPVMTISLAQQQLKGRSKKQKKAYDILQPSSLEMNDDTGEMYVLDAVNHRLYTLDQQGRIQKAKLLDKKQLRQPEGLAFSDTGDMYVSSEGGKTGKALILKLPESM
ncbi:SdiA-regulated domain-containing protein [Pontibacter toksunensis]|uniref:SdiA-regulated domain-containing protein n=1 Tax=Pontibacter toksunensis TaxID=1332631 RepID=A0ABW6C4I5_9BACT